jgi:hypothetical protein
MAGNAASLSALKPALYLLLALALANCAFAGRVLDEQPAAPADPPLPADPLPVPPEPPTDPDPMRAFLKIRYHAWQPLLQ